jgi:hypothetical protein
MKVDSQSSLKESWQLGIRRTKENYLGSSFLLIGVIPQPCDSCQAVEISTRYHYLQ